MLTEKRIDAVVKDKTKAGAHGPVAQFFLPVDLRQGQLELEQHSVKHASFHTRNGRVRIVLAVNTLEVTLQEWFFLM